MSEIRIRVARPRRQIAPAWPPIGTDVVVERDDGLFQIGLHDDAAGPFPSRAFAQSVASGHPPAPAPTTKFRRIQIGEGAPT